MQLNWGKYKCLALICTFWGQNMLKTHIKLCVAPTEIAHRVTYVQELCRWLEILMWHIWRTSFPKLMSRMNLLWTRLKDFSASLSDWLWPYCVKPGKTHIHLKFFWWQKSLAIHGNSYAVETNSPPKIALINGNHCNRQSKRKTFIFYIFKFSV